MEGHSTIGPSSQLLGVVDLAPRWMNMASEGLGAARKRLQLSSENDVAARGTLSRSCSAQHPVVFIIDDDASIREALRNLFQAIGLRVEVYSCAAELLGSKLPDTASCLVLDVRLPRMSGIDFQAQLAQANIHIPIVFMTGYGDIPMTVRAMKAGAVDFLTKPFRDQDMLDAVSMAIARDRMRRDGERLATEMRARFDALSTREREVMALVTSGLLNKQAAAKAGLAVATVKIHRGRVMKKMGAKSLVDLVRMAEILGVGGSRRL